MTPALKDVRARDLVIADIHMAESNGRLDPESIKQLAETMKAGVINPIRVRENFAKAGRFEVVAGRRRIAAARLLGWKTIPATIVDLSDFDAAIERLNENLQREDLHPLDQAEEFRAAMKLSKVTLEQLAMLAGKPVEFVRDRLRFSELIDAASKHFREGHISIGQAVILSKLKPADQKAALEPGRGGVFHENYEIDLPLGDDVKSTELPRTVAETKAWVDENVRLDPKDKELPQLFPATAANLIAAEEKKVPVVQIVLEQSYNYPKPKKGETPILEPKDWRRADGSAKSKICDRSAIAVVVLGSGRGESFRVCVDHDCKVHWAAEKRAARAKKKNKSKTSTRSDPSPAQKRWEQQQAAEQALKARWTKARPQVLEAVAKAITKAPAGPKGAIGQLLIKGAIGYQNGAEKNRLSPGSNAESLVRYLGWLRAAACITPDYASPSEKAAICKSLGLDPKKLLDEHAPVANPKAEPKKKGGRK